MGAIAGGGEGADIDSATGSRLARGFPGEGISARANSCRPSCRDPDQSTSVTPTITTADPKARSPCH